MSDKKSAPPTAAPGNPNPDYQDRDIKLAPVVWSLVALSVAAVLSAVAMYATLSRYRAQAEERAALVSPLASIREVPAGPLLQVNASQELAEHRAAQAVLLDHYGWADQIRGVARIPVSRAMEMIAVDEPEKPEADDHPEGESEAAEPEHAETEAHH